LLLFFRAAGRAVRCITISFLLYNTPMPTFYTKTGDDGYTGLLGEGRVPKEDPRLEAVGTLDEASAALGLARASCLDPRSAPLLLQAQRDLYGLMTEVAATPENASRFRSIDAEKVTWLEQQTDLLSSQVEMPKEFILPGDSPASAALALARTIVRRAERRVAQLLHAGELENLHLLRYLNRLSSLCFAFELVENQAAGNTKPTLAKE
jgi:cob(I)alamin adenosyltransferase